MTARFRRLPLLMDRRGAVAVMFGLCALPLVAMIGLAIDYAFYIQARSQLNLAVDAAALHAVRVASQDYGSGAGAYTSAQAAAAGQVAGQQWFAAQLGTEPIAVINNANLSVPVVYTASPSGFSSTASISGTMPLPFGNLFNFTSWPLNSSSTAVITNSYFEVLLLLDNSPSMLIGATTADMLKMEEASICAVQPAADAKPFQTGNYISYPWDFTTSQCMSSYTSIADAPQSLCFNPNSTTANPMGQILPTYRNYTYSTTPHTALNATCVNAAGQPHGGGYNNVPLTPCALACHDDASNNDLFGSARQIGVTLRLDLVEQAAANVITKLQSLVQSPNQFSVGVYQFNNDLAPLYPGQGNGEAGTNFASALTLVQNTVNTPLYTPPGSSNTNTYFSKSVSTLLSNVTAAGNGQSASTPLKSIIIVTDGVSDTSVNGAQSLGPVTSSTNEQVCQQLKNLGFTVLVLYTSYIPIPIATYVGNMYNPTGMIPIAEPTNNSSITAALQACASAPADFLQVNATDTTSINTAMQTLLATALNSPTRVAN
jgi:Flp pilus assembly protein TadG